MLFAVVTMYLYCESFIYLVFFSVFHAVVKQFLSINKINKLTAEEVNHFTQVTLVAPRALNNNIKYLYTTCTKMCYYYTAQKYYVDNVTMMEQF